MLLLGIYRDSELTHDHPLVDVVADLRRQGSVERLLLSGLDDVSVTALVEQLWQSVEPGLGREPLLAAGAQHAEQAPELP